MGTPVRLAVQANGGGDVRPLVYQWSIIQTATGQERLTNLNGNSTFLEVWQNNSSPSTGVGQTIQVKLVVSFSEATAEDTAAEYIASIAVSGRNLPPVPKVKDLGGFGTPTARIPTGSAVNLIDDTSDPDGDPISPNWSFGEKRNVGTYIGSLVLIGSHGFVASFTVPGMTGNIDQDVRLTIIEGLYTVSTTVTTYLTATSTQPPPGTTNRAPTLTVSQPSLSKVQGETAVMQVDATDLDGDALAFNWFLNSVTVQQPAVVSPPVQLNSTTWRSTLTYPTAGLAVGGPYTFSVRARETSTASPLQSGLGTISLYVTPAGSTGAGYFQATPTTCEGSNASPQLVGMAPDPRVSELRYLGGQPVRVELTFADSTQTSNPLSPTPITGISAAEWNFVQLTQKGVTPGTSLEAAALPTQARAIISFNAPTGQSGESRVSVTARDVLGCPTTVEFGIVFQQPASGTSPTAKIRYQQEGSWLSTNDLQTITGPAARTLVLDAGESTDDGGFQSLTFTWQVAGIAGAQVSPSTGSQTTLTIPASAVGIATVTLTARDAQGQEGISRLLVNYGGSSTVGVPTAKIVFSYLEGNSGTSGPHASNYQVTAAEGRKIRLDGRQSTDSTGTPANLDFQWVVWGFAGASLNSDTAAQVDLTVPEGKGGTARILLVVTDRSVKTKDAIQISFEFAEDQAAYPVAQLFYSEDDGSTFHGPATNGQVLNTSRRNIVLRAGPEGEESSSAPTYFWTTGGMSEAVLSSFTGKQVHLTLPVGQPGLVTVTLTATNAANLDRSVEVKFAVDFSAPTARIVKSPTVVTKGQPFEVQGSGISGGGSGSLRYHWQMECCDSLNETGGGRIAQLVLPNTVATDEDDVLKLSLRVEEDGALSEPEVREIPIQNPRLQFSQWAAGPLGDEGLRFETSVVLVNSLDDAVTGTLVLHTSGVPGSEQPNVTVRDDLDRVTGAETAFQLDGRGAIEFTVTSEELWFGWLEILPTAQVTGHVFYRVVENVGPRDEIRWEVPILPVLGAEFRTFMPGQGGCTDSAICPQVAMALINLSDSPAEVRITLRDPDGTEFSSPNWTLQGREHRARFLSEIFKPAILQAFGGGTLSIHATEGSGEGRLSATVIRTVGGLPLSILPVVVK